MHRQLIDLLLGWDDSPSPAWTASWPSNLGSASWLELVSGPCRRVVVTGDTDAPLVAVVDLVVSLAKPCSIGLWA